MSSMVKCSQTVGEFSTFSLAKQSSESALISNAVKHFFVAKPQQFAWPRLMSVSLKVLTEKVSV